MALEEVAEVVEDRPSTVLAELVVMEVMAT